MLYSKVFLRIHWGFSISIPKASKAKPSFLLPPPSTLIGALSYGKFRGIESVNLGKNTYGSPSYNFSKVKATAALETESAYVEDIVRNIIQYFQRPERKMEYTYWYGVIPTGKVFSPNGLISVIYITDSLSKEELERLSWSIIRLGCKECLVSVEDVKVGEAKPIKGKVKTKYYFPDTVKMISGNVEYVDFWDENGFIWGKEGKSVRYVLPLNPYPIRSIEVEVEAKEGYEVDGDYVVFS